jgi:hypothetical protein
MVFPEQQMSRYLDILRKTTREAANCEKSEIREDRSLISQFASSHQHTRVLATLESRCPDHVPTDHWQQAVEDGRRFLAQWGAQADALGWTARDLFGLAPVPDRPRPSYRRTDLAAAWPAGAGTDRRHCRNREPDRDHHRLSTPQQASAWTRWTISHAHKPDFG